MSLPPLDICKLEAAGAGCGVDMNEVWHVVCRLRDETDNIRITGNPLFDGRYLNYDNHSNRNDNNFYDRDSKVKGDWRTHFFTRTAQILLHSSDPQRLPSAPVHSERCDCVRPEIPERDVVELGCDCWGHGIDPAHQVFLQRLMTVPPHSNIAKTFCKMEQRSAHFEDIVDSQYGDLLLVPFRYAKYFTTDANTNVLDLLSTLVNACQFRPKLFPVHCEFFFYGELYQSFLSVAVEQNGDEARRLFTEFLSDVESVEFYWIGGLRGPNADGEMTFQANPSMHIPKLFLETVLSSPSPHLDTLCIRMYGSSYHFAYDMPSIDSCLNDIAPLLSPSSADESKSKSLPISAPYKGLKKLHIFGEIKEEKSRDVISSVILHQTVVEGLEIRCNSRVISPGNLLDPIFHVLTQPTIQFLVVTKWRDYDFKGLFCKFLDVNADCEISFATWSDEVVIPAQSQTSSKLAHRKKFLRLLTVDSIFSLLNEAKVDVPLRSVTMKSPIKNEQCFLSFLTTCQVLTLQVKGTGSFPFSGCFEKLSCNRNLQVLRIHGCLPFISLIDGFCAMLSAVYTNCAGSLTELSLLNNRIGSLPPVKLKLFFKTLLSFPSLGQLSVNLRGNDLKDAALSVLLDVWRATKTRPAFKTLSLDSSEQEERVAEMVLEW